MRLFPYGPKIYPKTNDNELPTNMKIGNQIIKTEESKKLLTGFNNKFVGYKDASQLTRMRASKQVAIQIKNTEPKKFNLPNDVNDALRRNRNSGARVPPKVTNKKMCSY